MNHEVSDPDRIAAIKKSGLLDGAGSKQFDLITEHVRVALKCPVAIISIVDENRQVFAGHCGLPSPWDARGQTPMTHSFCQHVVERADPLIVNDANIHELVHENHAIADLGVIGYLGVPIALPSGELVGALAAIDTKPRQWTDHELKTLETLAKVVEREIAVGVSEIKYRRMFEDMQEGYYVAGAVRDSNNQLVDVTFEEINPAFSKLTGLPHEDVVGKRLSEIMPSAMKDMIPAYKEVLDTGEVLVHVNNPEALGKWYENRIRKLDEDHIASVFTDVSERKDNEAAQTMLHQEMAHRLKNTLAMVQAIATQTLRPIEDRTFVHAFEQRLHALSSAHDILFRKNWHSAKIADVVESVIDKIGLHERFDVEGPDISMGPRATLSTSLILHEMATNAVKYGALSNETGRVSITWRLDGSEDDAQVEATWQEFGGPSISPPKSKGFGSKLVRMGLIGSGGVAVSYEAAGFKAVMSASLSQLRAE